MSSKRKMIGAEDDRTEPFVWVNLEFCELDIDPASKAVYLEIVKKARREDGSGGCWESVENIAHWANVSVAVAKRSLRKLIDWNLVSRESRGGRTSIYRLKSMSQWKAPKLSPPKKKEEGGSNLAQVKNDPAQKQPGSNTTQGWLKSSPGGGSNLTHKLDPNELDPNELDPLSNTQNEISIAQPEQPESESAYAESEPAQSGPGQNSTPVNKSQSYDGANGSDRSSAARCETRMKSRVSNKPMELEAVGLGHLWVGPKRGDFDPWLIKSVQQHLRKYDRPALPGDAITAIANMIQRQEWTKLEQRAEEGRAMEEASKRIPAAAIAPSMSPPIDEPIDIEARKAGLARMKAAMQESRHGLSH